MSELTDAISAALGGVEDLLAHRDPGADGIDHRVRDGGAVGGGGVALIVTSKGVWDRTVGHAGLRFA